MKIPPGWDIPTELRVRLGDRSGRQRELISDGHLVLVLHQLPTARGRHREGIYFWRAPGGTWRTTERGQPKRELQLLVERYEAEIVRLEELHDSATTAAEKFSVLERTAPIHRAIRNMYDTLSKARDDLDGDDVVKELQGVCDLANDVARSAELLYADAKASLDFHIALQSERQAAHSREVERASHRLNSIAAIFLPLTAVASVFGMNLQSGFEEAPAWMFWFVVGASITGGFVVSEMLTAFKLWRKRDST